MFLFVPVMTFYWVTTSVLDDVLNAEISNRVVLTVLMCLLLVSMQNCADDLHNSVAPVYIWFLMSAKYLMQMLILLYLCILQSWKAGQIHRFKNTLSDVSFSYV